MSWNPRRFAMELHSYKILDPEPTRLWITNEGMQRIESGLRHKNGIQLDPSGVPTNGVWIGLQKPIQTAGGDADIIYVQSRDNRIHAAEDGLRIMTTQLAQMLKNPSLSMQQRMKAQAMLKRTQAEISNVKNNPGLWEVAGMILSTHRTGDEVVSTWVRPDTWEGVPSDQIGTEDSTGLSGLPGTVVEGAEGEHIVNIIRAALTLFNSPTEREISATTASPQRVTVGKKRKARDYDVTVIDINAPLIEREPSGEHRHVDWQFQWGVRPHERRIWSTDENGNRVRRVIPVKGYRKGPQDKPFKDRKVYQL